jgi:hypothetical protein
VGYFNRARVTHPIFFVPVIEAIYGASEAVPRKVDLLVQTSLMPCAAKKSQIVDAGYVCLSFDMIKPPLK